MSQKFLRAHNYSFQTDSFDQKFRLDFKFEEF